MAQKEEFDVVVVGSGPGGYVAAIRSAQLGMKTAIIERDKLGGICLNWGCIPTKALLKNAEVYEIMKNRSKEFGIKFDNLQLDFKKVVKRSRNVANRLSKGVGFLMRENKITTFSGQARFLAKDLLGLYDADQKEIDQIRANHIILATGARARSIPGIEIDRKKVISSREAMTLSEIPKSMLILGAGAIGIEFAYMYHAFGTEITMIEMMPTILPVEDKEVSQTLQKLLSKKGIKIHTESRVEKVKRRQDGVEVTVKKKDGNSEKISGDLALMAIGVTGNVENLALEDLNIECEGGAIKVDNFYRTNIEGIYAIGDVIGSPWLAHVASHEGIICVEKIAGHNPRQIDYDTIPGCTYCQPQVASIGLTEEKAKEKGYEIKVGKFPFMASGKAVAIAEKAGFVKLIYDAECGQLLGAHILGSEATEMIAELSLAKSIKATVNDILNTIHAHPTLSEAVVEATGEAFGQAIHI